MALISEFFAVTTSARPHPTHVQCGYQTLSDGDELLLQLSTYGSMDRKSGAKVSQTLQLNKERAKELAKIIDDAFPGILREFQA